MDNFISEDGQYALCSTADSPKGVYNRKIFIFDLINEKLIKSIQPKNDDLRRTYQIDSNLKTILINYNDGDFLKYNFDGELIK